MTVNDIQHGGTHYKRGGDFQSWDFIALFGLNFFEGNILKYVWRARFRGKRIQDLEKAHHYTMKLLDLHQQHLAYRMEPNVLSENAETITLDYAEANDLTKDEIELTLDLIFWVTDEELLDVGSRLGTMLIEASNDAAASTV